MTVSPKTLILRFPDWNPKSRPKIFPGDTLSIVYEARKVDANDFKNVQGLPEEVLDATAKVRSLDNDTWVEIGGVGVTEVDAQVAPSNGNTGAIISYTFPSSVSIEGDYIIYIKAVFADGDVYTANRKFQVQEFGR